MNTAALKAHVTQADKAAHAAHHENAYGTVITNGVRELHILGATAQARATARTLVTTTPFDDLWRQARRGPAATGPNVRYIKLD